MRTSSLPPCPSWPVAVVIVVTVATAVVVQVVRGAGKGGLDVIILVVVVFAIIGFIIGIITIVITATIRRITTISIVVASFRIRSSEACRFLLMNACTNCVMFFQCRLLLLPSGTWDLRSCLTAGIVTQFGTDSGGK